MPTSEIYELPANAGYLVRICGVWDTRLFRTGYEAVQYLRDALCGGAQ
jgi:hypothetical protein